MEYKMLNWHRFGDDRGSLVALEAGGDIPFAIKRVFYIFNAGGGGSCWSGADTKASTVLFMLKGSCSVTINDGEHTKDIRLSNPSQGLFLPPLIWKEVRDLSANAVVAVITDHKYNADNNLDNYEDYLKCVLHTTAA